MKITIVTLLLAVLASPLFAQQTEASGEFTLQGRLTTTGGQAIADGSHQIMVELYNRTTGELVYSETDAVTTVDGIFSTYVGDNGSSQLMIDAEAEYEIGISVDGGAQLSPRLEIGDAISAITAELAADARAVNGFSVSTDGSAAPNSILVLDAQGRIPSAAIEASTVTSINGMSGNINLEGGGDLMVDTIGGTLRLSFTGSASGVNLPFSDTLNVGANQTAFELRSTGEGSAAAFINTAGGAAVDAYAETGAAVRAVTNSATSAAVDAENMAGVAVEATTSSSTEAAIEARNTAGAAIDASANATANAVLRLQNTASETSARLISAMNAAGNTAFEVAADGRTTIRATSGTALDVATEAAGEAALKLTGGLQISGPVGVGTISSSESSVVIDNDFVDANSIILLTVRSGVDALPLRISSQGDGTFTVSLLNSTIGSLTGDLSFNYLIINQ